MTHIKYNYRFFLKPNGRVMIRLRWNGGKSETSTTLSVFADRAKWNPETQRAIRNTNHDVGGTIYTARMINDAIEKAIDIVDTAFSKYELEGMIPSVQQMKELLADKVTPNLNVEIQSPSLPEPDLDALYEQFIAEYGKENNWAKKTHCKYHQAFMLLKAYRPKLAVSEFNKKFMNDFKYWLIENSYKNTSITKYFRCIRTMLRWIKEQGYAVQEEMLGYRTKLAVPTKTVIYLKYEEVLHFESFKFPGSKQYLARVRDMFCFMCYTSLRYSDLKGLKKAAIADNTITMFSQKTKGKLHIPLVSHAVAILNRYLKTTPGDYVFPVPSPQKMNTFLKEAAKLAGLDREVMDTTFCGNERIEEVMKLHEAISCHDARRTFVCISLSLGIPQTVVMSCTGHSDYATMKPYIAISEDTSRQELVKWEIGSVRNKINKILDDYSEEELLKVLDFLNRQDE